MRKVKNLDQLYEELKAYGTVLTADAALADALNRRLDRPIKGDFASTPGRLASSGDELSRKDIFLKAVEETDYSWKQISYSMDKIFEAWKHTGNLEEILEFERYENEMFEEIVGIVKEYESSFNSVEKFEAEGEIAVVNLFQFNELDRTVLPEEFDRYSMFEDESTGFEEFNIFESGLDLVNSLVKNIESVGAENAGIVVRPDSRYQSLLESVFRSQSINYTRSENISRDTDMRTFIAVLEAGVTDRRLRVRDVKPLQEGLGLNISGDENSFISSSDSELKEFINIIEYMEFSEALDQFEEFSGREFSHIRGLINDLGISSEPVNRENVRKLSYFLSNFDSKIGENNTGVLLADPKNASVIDRPVVFLVGMSSEWNEETPEEPWMDETWFEEKSRGEFEIIAQSGDKTVYMVQDQEFEEDIKPCFRLDEVIGETVENFRQLPHSFRSFNSGLEASSFEKEEIDKKEIDSLSQSSLNDLARSPRLFYMSRLVSKAEEEHLLKGQLFHEFAELYSNHPEEVKEKIDRITEFFAEKMEEVVDDTSMIQIRTEIDKGLENLMEFLDSDSSYSGKGYNKEESENELAENLGLDVSSSPTEMEFNSEVNDSGMKGKVDLIESENHLVDFKSGRKKSVKDIVKASRPQTFEDVRFPDFQALMYLAHHSKYVDGEIEFSFVYFLNELGSQLTGQETDEMVTTVKLIPKSFDEKLSSNEMFEFLIKDVKKSNNRRKTLEKLGYSVFEKFFDQNEFPEIFDKDEITESQIYRDFEAYALEEVGDYKYVRKGVKSAFRKIIEYRNTRYFREDVENIEAFVREQIENLSEYEEEGYPIGERDISELGKEDLIV